MKILIYSDIHISQDSSIVKSFGKYYSTRLEYIIKSITWAENLATNEKCDLIFNLGDTFNKPIVNAMEATAVQDICWADIPHYILVGNHDSDVVSLEYSSVSILKKLGFHIIKEVTHLYDKDDVFTFIPYILEDNRKPLTEYLVGKNDIVLSHNDIAGFRFGNFVSKEGFKIDDIEKSCKLFLNGHLHNSSFLSDKILNVGNLCGQNFTEDSLKYSHGCWILDTKTNSLEFHENPYALNFYKLEYPADKKIFSNLKNNSVLMVKCERSYQEELKNILTKYSDKIVTTRVLLYDKDIIENIDTQVKLDKVDHLKQFTDFIHEQLGNTELINEELMEVCK